MRIAGDVVPESLIKEPNLSASLQFFIDVFEILVHERDVVNVPTKNGGYKLVFRPIKISSVLQYAAAFDITGDLRDDLIYFIIEMDAVYCEEVNKD